MVKVLKKGIQLKIFVTDDHYEDGNDGYYSADREAGGGTLHLEPLLHCRFCAKLFPCVLPFHFLF